MGSSVTQVLADPLDFTYLPIFTYCRFLVHVLLALPDRQLCRWQADLTQGPRHRLLVSVTKLIYPDTNLCYIPLRICVCCGFKIPPIPATDCEGLRTRAKLTETSTDRNRLEAIFKRVDITLRALCGSLLRARG